MKFNEISISIFLKFQFSHSFRKKNLESNCQTKFFKVKAKKSDLRVKSWALPGRFSCWRSAHLTLPVGGPKITKLLILKVLDVQSSMAAADARTAMVHTHGQGRPRSPIRQRQCNSNCLQNTPQPHVVTRVRPYHCYGPIIKRKRDVWRFTVHIGAHISQMYLTRNL